MEDVLPASICDLPEFILSHYFTGRSDELQHIEQGFSASSGDLPARCVIHGMPGLGKTQLALKYAKLASQKGECDYILWISASSVERLAQGLSKLVELLRLPGRQNLDQVKHLVLARAWLEDQTVGKQWLLILDNVQQETLPMVLQDILPRRNGNGRLLLTTRTAAMAELCTMPGKSLVIALRPPEINEAVKMLTARAGMDSDSTNGAGRTDLERLVRSIGSLPLAIDQAASYMKSSGSGPKQLLDLYQSKDVEEVLSWENDLSLYEEKSVAATFAPALNKIRQTAPDALTLLRVFSLCDPERVPLSILEQGCTALKQESMGDKSRISAGKKPQTLSKKLRTKLRLSKARAEAEHAPSTINNLAVVLDLFQDKIRVSKAIQDIERSSLAILTKQGSEREIRIHDLVHLLLRSILMTIPEQKEWLSIVIKVVCEAFYDIDDIELPRNWSRCCSFVRHIEFMGNLAEEYGL
ncbi:MAG: hypothetical protein Q9220_000826 [cf. Caloplaca sp. 1 TL-2023]